MNQNKISMFSIMIAAGLWGMSGVILTPQLGNLNVWFAVFLQYVVAFMVMQLSMAKEYRNFFKLKAKDIIILVSIALFAGILGTVAIVQALFICHFSNLSIVILFQKFQPIFAVLLAMIFLKERPGVSYFLWFVVVLIAGYFLAFGWNVPEFNLGDHLLVAVGLSIFAALCFASNTVLGRYLSKEIAFETITFYRYFFSCIILLVIFLFIPKLVEFHALTSHNLWAVFWITLLAGPYSLFLYYYGLKSVKASVATICELAMPIAAVLLDHLVNHAHYSLLQWVSAGVMMTGIYIISRIKISG